MNFFRKGRKVTLEGAGFAMLLAAPVTAVVLFGAAYPYAYSLVFLLVLTAGVLGLPGLVVRGEDGRHRVRLPATPLTPLFLLMGGFLVFQMTPLPAGVLRILSPESLILSTNGYGAETAGAGGAAEGAWAAVAPYRFPVRQSLVRWTVYGLFFFLLVAKLNSHRRIVTAVRVLLVTALAVMVYGFLETYSGHKHVLWVPYEALWHVGGTYFNRNPFGGLMTMTLMLALGYGFAAGSSTGARRRVFPFGGVWRSLGTRILSLESGFRRSGIIFFAAVLLALGLMFSASRGAMISAAVALPFLGGGLALKRGHRKKGFAILLFGASVLLFTDPMGIDRPLNRFESLGTDFQERARWVRTTLELHRDYRWVGTGVGNFEHAYPRYQRVEDARRYLRHAHNDWVQLLAETGVAGFGLFVAGALVFLIRMARLLVRRHSTFAVCLGAGSLAALVSIAVHSFSDFNLHLPAQCLVLATILAIGYVSLNTVGRGHAATVAVPCRRPPLKGTGGLLLAGMFAAILATGGLTARHFVAEARCGTVQDASLQRDPRPPLGSIEAAVRWDPANAAYYDKLAAERIRLRDEYVSGLDPGKAETPREAAELHRRQAAIVNDLESSVRRNPLDAWALVRLGWACHQMWRSPSYRKKWLPAADFAMMRAAYLAGEASPDLYAELGNYWAVQSTMTAAGDTLWQEVWNRACWHYRKAMELEHEDGKNRMYKRIHRYVWGLYPDMAYIRDVLGDS